MREYVICICFAMLFCAAADILVPSPKYRGIIRIVCGIFVIGTIVSPIKELIKFDYGFNDADRYLKDDYGFFSQVETSRDIFMEELIQNAGKNTADMIAKELESIFGGEIKAQLYNGKLRLHGTGRNIRSEVTYYVKKHYALDTIYAD